MGHWPFAFVSVPRLITNVRRRLDVGENGEAKHNGTGCRKYLMEQRKYAVTYEETLGYCRKLAVNILAQPRPFQAIVAINASGTFPASLLAQLLGIERVGRLRRSVASVNPPGRPSTNPTSLAL